jgi:hypothetical protein
VEAGVIDAYASEPHFEAHIRPMWAALPSELRGTFHTRRQQLGRGAPVIVAAYRDLRGAAARTAVFLEHGAGQTYGDSAIGNYSGGRGRDNVGLFLSPNETVAERNRARYPGAEHAVVGCPKLDRYARQTFPAHNPPVVAISFHWECLVAPESRSAFRHYQRAIASLAGQGFDVLGHAHPRMLEYVRPTYQAAGIEVVADFDDVVRRADVYACDNSSTLFEFAATGRPVVTLNCPWYRRDVSHGLRFWDFADVGVQVDDPDGLAAAIEDALGDTPQRAERRRDVADAIYGIRDGAAAQRAAGAVVAWLAADRQAVAA